MFKPVSPRVNVPVMEEGVLRFWKSHDIFHQSTQLREGAPEYVFFEGPPTANGKPGVHHVLARAFKDVFPRYKTMRGYHVIRRGGWDTHGLPVEIEVEKKLGFTNKQQIEDFGIARFNELCRESAFTYIQDWERLTERIAFWVDLEKAYITYTNDYIESVWWILKNFWDEGLIYRGYKVVPYCPRCGTPLSDHEVALGYDEATDPSVFVRMPLVDTPDTSLLVWTTTPWTLPANVAVAAHPEVDYVKVERALPEGGKEYLILAEPLLKAVFGEEEVRVVERFKGTALRGKRYKPLFTFIPPEKPAHRVVLAEFVTIEDGTGLVHIAPAFGAEDMNVALEEDLPIIHTVASDGTFIAEVRPWSGMFVKDADPLITRDLDARGLLFRAGTYTHTYPFCWRCSTPLLYYARPTWYIRTSQYRNRLVELNERINWYPSHIKNGRFGNWLENNIDWALGRERYWGTPLPVWECESCHHEHMVGSVKELSEMAGRDLSGLDLHRPHVDEVVLKCPECGGRMTRVPELIDVWFDSGSMPVAQWHYPFENQDIFKKQFPADFICEAVDQTRGWFYSLHAISTLLFDSECYKNVICLGLILDKNGQKMSKSRGNIVDPWDVIRQHGADAMRWYLYTATPPGQERRFSAELVGEVVSNFTLTLWNTYSFFVTYANLDGWKPEPGAQVQYNSLDRWLLSALHALVRDVTNALETYDVLGATRPIETFVDQLSNWYLRRSRRRFWKSGSDADKKAAYATLYEALVTLSKLLAPTMPFLAEELYQNLVRSVDENAPLSVHMSDWPSYDPARIDEELNREMALVMKLASLGHAARNKANRKVRQPLQEVAFAVGTADEQDIPLKYADLLEDELNVKQVRMLNAAGEAVSYSLNPLPKQLGQKYGNRFPAIRQALLALDAAQAAQKLLAGQSLPVEANGETYEILPEEVEVRMQARSGYAVASEGAYLAALTTELTPELIREGLAREFVRRVQDLRKNAGLDIADRIEVVYQASDGLAQAIEAFREYIMNETLTLSLNAGVVPAEMATTEDSFDGETVKIGLRKVAR
ncbi:isoleucine--tRNA ligase [Anaerolinea thermophila]|uniref:Isoleucine--tRNA ligase n=1 Tax=Anaerolinea thermophila (strain DSM 14523 / JCM 11388 / NBRC 100420 / UNI-1) TaxID=926569 RepID=E8MY80_ANATU|nr:isoleucine--tRNA ligase [Anaerolinea thermophila]BAJ64311.1 isoleucyl-tRNA synthetase [Anaerolinea thermophila UNI-1]